MPYKDPEARKDYLRKKRSDPEWNQKRKEYFRQYYVEHVRQFRGYSKKYRQRTAKDPERIAAQRRAYKKYYYAKVSKTPEYNKHMREYGKRNRTQIRDRVLDAYGAKCACCGESIRQFLSVDHIHGSGTKHMRKRGVVGVCRDIIKEGFPKDKYRILCMNCNWARSVYGVCPHGDSNKFERDLLH